MSQVMLWQPVQNPLDSLFRRTFMSSLRLVMSLGSMFTALVSSEVRAALAPMPATSTYSHAPSMSTHASLSAKPSLVPKCISPDHEESVSPASGEPYTSQPQSNSHCDQVQFSIIVTAQLQQTQIIAVIIL